MKPETRIAELEQHIATLQQDLNDARNGWESATEELRQVDARIAELESKLAMADAEVTRLAVAAQPVETIDGAELTKLIFTYADQRNVENFAAIIMYIDARLAAANHKAWCAEVNADGAHEELAEVREAGMADKRDAERWRYLRRSDNDICVVVPDPPDDAHVPHTEALDSAIDAAMTQDQKGT